MSTEKPRFSVTFKDDSFSKIKQYQAENKISTQSKAVSQLVELALIDLEKNENKNSPPYSSEALEVARIYDTLDDKGKQRLREAAEREDAIKEKEDAIKAAMDNLMHNIVVLRIHDDPIVGSAGIELQNEKLRDHPFSIPQNIPSEQREVLIKLRDKQIRRPLGIRFRYPNQDYAQIVFVIDQGVQVTEGQLGLFTIDGKSYLGKAQNGQFFIYPENINFGQDPPNIKSEGVVIGFVDLKYLPGI